MFLWAFFSLRFSEFDSEQLEGLESDSGVEEEIKFNWSALYFEKCVRMSDIECSCSLSLRIFIFIACMLYLYVGLTQAGQLGWKFQCITSLGWNFLVWGSKTHDNKWTAAGSVKGLEMRWNENDVKWTSWVSFLSHLISCDSVQAGVTRCEKQSTEK